MTTSIDVSEEEISIKGDDLDLTLQGRIPDKWALYIVLLIGSMLGLDQLGVMGL
jgi:hypothetical protein